VQQLGIALLLAEEDRKEAEDKVDALKLALVSSDPDRWITSVYDIPVTEYLVKTPNEFLDKDGILDIENTTLKFDPITPEEAQAKMDVLLRNNVLSVADGKLV
jgi:hypothetical protein